MIELPESHVLAEQLHDSLVGKEVQEIYLQESPHKFAFISMEEELYQEALIGNVIQQVVPVGSFIRIDFKNCFLLLGEALRLRYLQPEDKLPPKRQLHLVFTDGARLTGSAQLYAAIMLHHQQLPPNEYYQVAAEKPTPYDDAFDWHYFLQMAQESSQKLSVKAFLATEQRIPGFGNGCLQDILLHAQLHPKTKLNQLSEADLQRLFDVLKSELVKMRMLGGRSNEVDLYGNKGMYQVMLTSKAVGHPCPVCGEDIEKAQYLGGTVYFCPRCQPLV